MTAVEHTTFVIERELPAPPRRAFRFWSDPALKERWNACHPDWTVLEDRFDFSAGGGETKRWRTGSGTEQGFRSHYLDIVAARRIIYAYEMSLGGARLSASLVTVELHPAGDGTRMVYTEQAAFLGAGAAPQRIAGTEGGLDRLVEAIARDGAAVH